MNLAKKILCIILAAVITFSVAGLFASAEEVLPKNASYISGDATGDGIVTTLKMLSVMAEEKKSLKELASALHMLPQLTINVRVSDKRKASSDPDVLDIVGKITEKLGSSGRVLMRHSDTESLIRVMVEAEDENTCRDFAEQIVSVIRSKGYAV